ncbi:restriction endonuclease subunit S [Escherichia coli]
MSSEWSENYLSDLTDEITVGYVGSMTHEYADSGIPFLRSKNISNYEIVWDDIRYISSAFHNKIKKSVLRPGDIAVVRTGKPGTSCVIPNELSEGNCSDLVIVRVDKNKLCPYYLCYYLNSIAVHQINSQIVGAVQQHFNVGSAKNLKIKSPSLLAQKKISFALQCLDDKIKLNKITNQTLEQMAQALFKSWFVDFEPVKAKIAVLEAGGSLEEATLAAMTAISGKDADLLVVFEREYPEQYAELKATAELFPSAMQESELGEIPEGWKVSSLEDVTSLIIDHRGKTPKKLGGDWSEEGHPAISAKNIKNGRLVRHDTIRYVDSNLYAKWMKDPLLAGDILMTSEAPLGELLYLVKDCDYLLSQRLYGIRADKEIISGCYLYFWLQTNVAKTDIDGRATGSTVVGIRQSELKKIIVMTPQKTVVESFSKLTALYLAKIDSNEKQNTVLENLRDTLLPKLLSGEITLPEAEQAVSEVENV